MFECDSQTCAHIAESRAVTQPHPVVDSSETNLHADVLRSGSCDDLMNAGRDVTEADTESKRWNMTGPEPAHYEDQNFSPEATVKAGLLFSG